MKSKNDLGNELLKENGIKPESESRTHREEILEMIKKDQTRIRQMKWVTMGLWAAALSGLGFRHFHSVQDAMSSENAIVLFVLTFTGFLVWAAIVSTILLWARSSSWIPKREINHRLALIEEELRHLRGERDDE
jgi:hypothetical protein